MENNTRENNSYLLRDAWFLIKRNFVLMLCIIILVTGLGTAYAFLKKPNYTASVKVRYMLTGFDGTYEDVTSMMAFVDTVVDFVDEGVVLDRASYYYRNWSEEKGNAGASIEEFIRTIETLPYDSNNSRPDSRYNYNKKKIDVVTKTVDNQTQFFFTIKYTAPMKEEASDRVRILASAYEKELQLKNDNDEYVYFVGLEIDIDEKGVISVDADVSKKKIILIAGVVGVVLAVIIAFIREKADNTIRNKNDVEELTDTKVLALLD